MPNEVTELLSKELVVEEKIDGANLGISFEEKIGFRFQNRGNWLEGKLTGQWERLRGWTAEHESSLRTHLPPSHVLFGEWCYAKHSIAYDRLPDWFLAFDVYDAVADRFWSIERRDDLLREVGLALVPMVASGSFFLQQLIRMLDEPSAFGNQPREGIYLRLEQDGWLVARAKLVSPEFVQQIGEHWSFRAIQPNRLGYQSTDGIRTTSKP